MLSTLCAFIYFIFTRTQWDWYHHYNHSHFTETETEPPRLRNLAEVTQLLNPCSLFPGQDHSAALFLSNMHIVALQLLSHIWLFWDPMDCILPGSSVHGNFPGKNTRVDCHFLPQGIFLNQGSNPHLLDWQADSSSLRHQGGPKCMYLLHKEHAPNLGLV